MTVWQAWTSNGSWTAPRGLYGPPAVYCQGPAGNAAGGVNGNHSGGGGGGPSFGGEPALGGVVPGTVLTITVPAAGSNTATTVAGGSVTVTGNPGGNASGLSAGSAGAASSNTIATGTKLKSRGRIWTDQFQRRIQPMRLLGVSLPFLP